MPLLDQSVNGTLPLNQMCLEVIDVVNACAIHRAAVCSTRDSLPHLDQGCWASVTVMVRKLPVVSCANIHRKSI